ncbi:MAG: hypothetical protein QOG99_3437, partial [Frankiales bacterium]|nr:hypothetical protein [Frankiales bacterium]
AVSALGLWTMEVVYEAASRFAS